MIYVLVFWPEGRFVFKTKCSMSWDFGVVMMVSIINSFVVVERIIVCCKHDCRW